MEEKTSRTGWKEDQHLFQVYTICTVLIICESNPDVISMPIHAGNRMKYRLRRFGFLYQGTLSVEIKLANTGSATFSSRCFPTATMVKVLCCCCGCNHAEQGRWIAGDLQC